MTIPGIGYINGGMILGEIGDIHRFSSPNKLLAYAGLDPSVYQTYHWFGIPKSGHTSANLIWISFEDNP